MLSITIWNAKPASHRFDFMNFFFSRSYSSYQISLDPNHLSIIQASPPFRYHKPTQRCHSISYLNTYLRVHTDQPLPLSSQQLPHSNPHAIKKLKQRSDSHSKLII